MYDATHDTDTDDAPIPSLSEVASARALSPLASPSVALAVRGAGSYAEQIAAAGLGWTVSKVPLYSADGAAEGRAWPKAYGVRRDDTGEPLGVVGPGYTPVQNTGGLADILTAAFGKIPAPFRPVITHTAAFRGGARVALAAELPAELSDLLRVRRDDSPIQARLSIMDTKDGGSSVGILPVTFRMRCENMVRAWNLEARESGLRIRHTAQVHKIEAIAGDWIKGMAASFAHTGAAFRAMDARPVSATRAAALVGEILEPEEAKRLDGARSPALERKLGAILEMIEARDGIYVPEGDVTAYSVLQAVTAYERHRQPVRGTLAEQTETRLEKVLAGGAVAARAVEVLLAA